MGLKMHPNNESAGDSGAVISSAAPTGTTTPTSVSHPLVLGRGDGTIALRDLIDIQLAVLPPDLAGHTPQFCAPERAALGEGGRRGCGPPSPAVSRSDSRAHRSTLRYAVASLALAVYSTPDAMRRLTYIGAGFQAVASTCR